MLPPRSVLHLITDLPTQTAAHTQLTSELRGAATWTGPRKLSSRAGARTQQVSWIDVPHNIWCASYDAHDSRFSLGFGPHDPRTRQSLPITAWINPAKGKSTQSSGAFIRDADGALYLCHTGKVGGGKKGVGKYAFLEWLDRSGSHPRVQVDGRDLVLVARLGSDTLVADIARYVTAIQAFKDEVGEANQSEDDEDDANNDEPWSLDTVLEELDPDQRRVILAWYADGIDQAHAVSPACWCITRRQGPRLRLLVGRALTLDLFRGRIAVGLNLPTLEQTDSAESDVGVADEAFAGLDTSVLRTYSVAGFLSRADQLRPAFERFIQLAGAAFRNTPFARYHASDLHHQLQTAVQAKLPRPAHAGDTPSYWKVSPGENGRLWDECREGGYIAIGWNELGDLSGLDREAFNARLDQALQQFPNWKRRGVAQAWRFTNIPEGARIVANGGTQRVLGIGTVTGPYRFVDDGREFSHRLPVEWDDTRERASDLTGLTSTVIQLSPDRFAEILAAPSPGEEPPEDPASEAQSDERRGFEGILDRLKEMGLQFPDDLVASYLLALQAKRFVVLSGISGTGKTQLALAIARTFQPSGAADDDEGLELEPDPDVRRMRVRPYMRDHRRLVVPAALYDLLSDGNPERVVTHFGDGQTESLRLSPAGTNIQLMFKGEFRWWFQDTLSLGDEFELRIGPEEPPHLHVTPVDQADAPRPIPATTYRVVAVRPDWTDNRGLLGYYNPITREYQPTPFLRLLLAAEEEYRAAQRARRPSHPFFAILDEMNLARVEHYFSDFLSCLESGEPIHLHDDPLLAAGASEDGDPVPMHVTIPPNLFLTGTVNVDETTYMFSPKVLDRAFVLEFNDVDLDTLGADAADDSGADPSPLALQHFTGALDVRTKPIDYGAFRGLLSGALHRALLRLNERLHAEHRHFGYRVANEIARFISLARTQAGEGADVLWEAFDVAVIAKVLPKLHGTQQELEEILERLLAFTLDVEADPDLRDTGATWRFADGRLVATEQGRAAPRLPRASAKLWRMIRRLRQVGFVSFIE